MNRTLQIIPGVAAPQGDDVGDVQQRLIELGILKRTAQSSPELAAEVYGAETVDAVREFQTDRGLLVDGIVGPQTWRALNSREVTQPFVDAPHYVKMNRLEAEVLFVAWAEFKNDVREVPWGSNRGPEVDRYLQWFDPPRPGYAGAQTYLTDPDDPTKGAKWCGLFGAACVAWACRRLNRPNPSCPRCDGAGKIPPPEGALDCSCLGFNPIRHWGDGAWVPTWWSKAVREGCLAKDLAPGQVALLGASARLRHLVLVASVNLDKGTFCTVEGNCDNGVRSRVRRIDEVGVSIKLPMPQEWK